MKRAVRPPMWSYLKVGITATWWKWAWIVSFINVFCNIFFPSTTHLLEQFLLPFDEDSGFNMKSYNVLPFHTLLWHSHFHRYSNKLGFRKSSAQSPYALKIYLYSISDNGHFRSAILNCQSMMIPSSLYNWFLLISREHDAIWAQIAGGY